MTRTVAQFDAAQPQSGILLIVAAMCLAAVTGGLMKLLTGEMSPLLVGWYRFTFYFFIMIPFVLVRVGPRAFRPPRLGVQVLRGLLQVVGNLCFMFGIAGLAYADAIAILYVYPFLMTLMAPMALGERVSTVGWLGTAGGFAGVLLVMRPEFSGLDHHALLVLGCGFMVALQMILNRKLGVVSDPTVVAMWGSLVAAATLMVGLPFFWAPIDMRQAMILVALACTSALSQWMLIVALTKAPASDLAPFTYAEIVSAVLVGLVMFGTLPDPVSWSGIALIVFSGVMVARAQGRTVMRRQPKI